MSERIGESAVGNSGEKDPGSFDSADSFDKGDRTFLSHPERSEGTRMPELIEAGALALSEYDQECETLEKAARRIFLAMLRGSRR